MSTQENWAELNELKAKLDETDLDDEVCTVFENKAADVNNAGIDAQIKTLVEIYGVSEVLEMIKEIVE